MQFYFMRFKKVYDSPKKLPLIHRGYSLTLGTKQYEKVTIFGDANSRDSKIT
jgi:hypothetical protein